MNLSAQNLWNEWHASGGPKYPHEKAIQFAFRNFPTPDKRHGALALDAGCGSGADTVFLAREGFSVTAFDISEIGVKNTKARLAAEGLSAEVFVASFDKVLLPTSAFDLSICMSALCYATYAASAGVKAIAASLKRGGRGIFVFASDLDYRVTQQTDLGIHGFTRPEVEAMFAPHFSEIAYDRYISTYRNGAEQQNDWLITVTR